MSKELIKITEEEDAKSLLKQMKKNPEQILLKLIESEGSEISQIESTTIRIKTHPGWYDLTFRQLYERCGI